jgi:F0F1-type ATP synthase assembly protein I
LLVTGPLPWVLWSGTASDPRQRGPCVLQSRSLTARGRKDVEEKPAPGTFDLMSMGLSSALMIGGGLGIGLGIDDWLHSSPIATLLGLAFGIACAIGSTVHKVRKFL